ncbi:MAG: hypothetical protein LBO06_00410 [Bacteroidales bacterium]|jgi:hypothetical protein|nr:hypothetical protein [Bacteroidales bacterium]
MKRAFVLLSCVVMAAACGTPPKATYPLVDEREVPEKFIKDFKRQKPDVGQAKWEKIDSLTYRANFTANGNKARMQFSNAEVLSSWIIPLEYCTDIKEYVAQNYEGFKLDEVILSDINRKEKAYFASISRKKDVKQLQFDLTQQFIKEVGPEEEKK